MPRSPWRIVLSEKKLVVTLVNDGGNAHRAGLRTEDVLLTYAGQPVPDNTVLQSVMSTVRSGKATLEVLRGTENLTLTVDAGPMGIIASERDMTVEFARRERESRAANMIVTTTGGLDGYRIAKAIDVVSAECVFGMNFFKDFLAGMSDIFGGRSETTQSELRKARETCLRELRVEAARLGANAVVGIKLDYSELSGQGKSMLFLVASGTAVILEPV